MSWDRIANTTIPRHMRKVENDTIRRRAMLNMLKRQGNILYDMGGDAFDWRVRWRDHQIETNDGEQAITFDRTDLWKKAVLDFGGYIAKDSYTKREKHQNKGNEAIVKAVSGMAGNLMQSFTQRWQAELFIDQSATGNTGKLVGLESMFAATQTLTVSSGIARTANVLDPCCAPSDTYAGLSTTLGNYAGTWNTQDGVNTTWPFGNGDAEYDFWSPVIVNYPSSVFSSTATWAANCVKATRFAVDAINARCAPGMGADLILLSPALYRQWKDAFDAYQRVNVGQSAKDSDWGFGESMDFDGCKVVADFDVPSGVGYVLSMANVEYHSCFSGKIFETEGPDYSIEAQAWRFLVQSLGQLKFASPKHFGKLMSLATT